MLKLVNIKKDYYVGDGVVNALKGINLTFRNSEFVSILGPSGCGKTTLLNLIGGLDHYTDGDLIIDNISTKKYGDRDWDTYRNHRIGFIFQSYNLIPHQTILENVELALNISGIEKSERIKRAKKALDEVGLQNQYNKKPNQLSGGQCQRVAIARALVNEPDILLADEPTGALDTVTSVQIMDLIKKIAEKRLVIMVTHNPELAESYSTRIIKLLDGEAISDSNPVKDNEKVKVIEEGKTKKSKLGFWSAFKLSARNLKSKIKRTSMVCFAGSIGIIGVSMVLAVSNGIQCYITKMQDDMLSGNPITVSEETYDLSKLMDMADSSQKNEIIEETLKEGYVNVDKIVETLVKTGDAMESIMVRNDITQEYVDYVYSMPQEYYSAIISYYGIDVSNNIYTNADFNDSDEEQMISLSAILTKYYTMLQMTQYKDLSQYLSILGDTFRQAPDSEEFILSQYDIMSNPETSRVAKNKNEIMIVIDREDKLTDLLLAQLGYYTQDEFFNVVYKATEDPEYNVTKDKYSFSYDELIGKKFVWYPNNTIYTKANPLNPLAALNPFTYNPIASSEWENGVELEITAILKPKKDIQYGCLTSGFYYTKAFTDMVIESSVDSEIAKVISEEDNQTIKSFELNGIAKGITYKFDIEYTYGGEVTRLENQTGYVGKVNQITSFMAGMLEVPVTYDLSLRDVGGKALPNQISIYPVDFKLKNNVTDYLKIWNDDKADITVNGIIIKGEDRKEITYSDNLSIIIGLIKTMIDIITYALVAFTSLSLVVSTVMIAIITYVSVIERVKEIGVIRALGGRKKDVSRLFNAETFIIGLISGLIGIGITYLLSAIINLIIGSLAGIYTIASLPISSAIVMIVISILLTLVSGLVPAKIAAKKDPVDALRSE